MAVIHQLKIEKKKKKKKRVGRGGKRGTYSGRGIKGQRARAGRKIKPQEKELLLRMPKLRGYKFNPLREKPEVINLAVLEKHFEANEKVNLKTLKEKKLISKNIKRVKILSKGVVSKPIIIEKLEVSTKAKESIEKAGGKIVI